jgi:branched-chain amino acid transport system substrate-binding protein
MKKLFTRRTVLSVAAIAATALTLTACDLAPTTIKIGLAQPLSGDLAALGNDMRNGLQLAVNEVNKKGFKVAGKSVKFEIVAMDDKGSSEEAKKIAQLMVDSGAVAVIGHLTSDASIQAAPIYAQKNIAQLAISTNPKFTELGLPTTFRLVANDNLQARAVGSYAINRITRNKFAIVDDGSTYGKSLANSVASILEGKKTIALRQSFDEKTKDFAALAAQIKADGIEVVVSTLSDFQVIALITELEKIDYSKQINILGTDALKTAGMVEHAGKVKNMIATSPVLDVNEFPNGRNFASEYLVAFKTAPVYASHYSYDAMYILAAAIKKADSADPAKITQTLRSLEGFAPITGAMRWTDKGEQREGTVSLYTVRGTQWESVERSKTW